MEAEWGETEGLDALYGSAARHRRGRQINSPISVDKAVCSSGRTTPKASNGAACD